MIKILFICHGNICRSPMAEMVMKDMVHKVGLDNEFEIDSAATSREEIGNGMHYGTKRKLTEMNIPYTEHYARQVTISDYSNYDYLIVMDQNNVRNLLHIIGNDNEHKVHTLLSFANINRDIADPWYTRRFDDCYEDVLRGCEGLLKHLGY